MDSRRAYSIGLDFGTGSVRAVVVDLDTGDEIGHGTSGYAHGVDGVVLDERDPNLARQHPRDYLDGLVASVTAALADARSSRDVRADEVVGIGVDTTGSTPIPVDRDGEALALRPEWADEPAALAWLWKDHTAAAEADEITTLARAERPERIARCGGTYSSEWFWAKVLRCARVAPDVFAAAHSWVELCDWVPAWLVGERAPERLARGVCAAGHKAMFAADQGGLPDAEFLARLDPRLASLRDRLYAVAHPADRAAGGLAPAVAEQLGLAAGTPVAVGAFDAHLGAVGAGVAEGDLVKVLGTSSCDMAIVRGDLPDVGGLCGVVDGSIVPGAIGLEAGQSAVGDVFAWVARELGSRDAADHEQLAAAAARMRPGESGLLALDWHNGNRCVLVDPKLSGLLVGLNLNTRADEIYRAMVEATAFGSRVIVDAMVDAGVPVHRLIVCGGIAAKSPFVVQLYADVHDREVLVSPSSETCALGAAITGAVAGGHFPTVEAAQARVCRTPAERYPPRTDAVAVYDELFALYVALHDAFGRFESSTLAGPNGVMKRLLALRDSVRG